MTAITWTEERVAFLTEHYPKQGRDWCAEAMGLTAGQIRSKASRMGLRANGVSEAWKAKQERHAQKLTGRKRPAQSAVMKQLHAEGKLLTKEVQKANGERISKWIQSNPHPRGMTGIKHSAATLSLIGSKSRARWAGLTPDQVADQVKKMMATKSANGTVANPRPKASWKAEWREIGGRRKYYRSRWEANYAYYLEWLKTIGEIADWSHEPKTFWFEGIKRGCVSYLPDFWVKDADGSESYHEVKGWMDDRSKTKIKRMAKYHPTVKLIVIDSKGYAALKRKVAAVVPGWEQ
uniref:Holliday junction resolvase n=1 Tax=Pakpunavirus sp. TaxID=2833053 RepID=A0AB39BYX4_9CAUD